MNLGKAAYTQYIQVVEHEMTDMFSGICLGEFPVLQCFVFGPWMLVGRDAEWALLFWLHCLDLLAPRHGVCDWKGLNVPKAKSAA